MNTKYHVELATNHQGRIRLSTAAPYEHAVFVKHTTANGFVEMGYKPADAENDKKIAADILVLRKGHETVAIRIVEDTSEQDAIEAQKARWLARNAGHAEAVSDYSVDLGETPIEGIVDYLADLHEDKQDETVGV